MKKIAVSKIKKGMVLVSERDGSKFKVLSCAKSDSTYSKRLCWKIDVKCTKGEEKGEIIRNQFFSGSAKLSVETK